MVEEVRGSVVAVADRRLGVAAGLLTQY